jgi:hypothetical protein
MKKILLAIFLITLIISCRQERITPIEKHGGSRFVVAKVNITIDDEFNLMLKNKDSIFWVTVLNFDGKNIKVGDTIR